MAKYKVTNPNLDQNLNGTNFNDTPSNTIFSFGSFVVTSNFDNKQNVDYTNTLSSFVRPVTLETMGVTEAQSEILYTYSTNAVLNLDKSDLNTFVRFGSAYEFLRISVQNIILAYPGSLYVDTQKNIGGNPTFFNFSYDVVSDISTFYVYTAYTTNKFGLVYNDGNTSVPDDNELKNLNNSFDKYVIWSTLEDNNFPIIGYTGNTVGYYDFYSGTSLIRDSFIKLRVSGNPFSEYLTGVTANTGAVSFHMKPNNVVFEEFRAVLNSYEKFIVSERDGINGFKFKLKDPTLLDDGNIIYSDAAMLWTTGDNYNVDIDTPNYQKFLKILLTIGAKYDKIKTDLVARFLSPASLKLYDYTEEGKMTKLLRLYGREFDQVRQFIDSLVYINKVTYDKLNNIPDQLVKNMARTFGWDYFSLVNESELVESFLSIDSSERNLNEDILPAEIDVELWRRILMNTSYFWKSKGTRQAIKSMFLLIGIPEPFINITEYVYTVDGKINPNTVPLLQIDFPSNSLPYDTEGYPVAPLETNDFYFQLSGNTDSGQAYLDVFRMAGFNLVQTVDNRKSWVQTGATTRVDSTTPQYYQEDNRLVINTKEVDVALDTARGIEYDVYRYIKEQDFVANSSGYTLPYSYVNISLGVSGTQSTFVMPAKTQGDFEVRYNGILLNAPKSGTTGGIFVSGITTGYTGQSDYTINYSANTFTITNPAYNVGNRRDVIQATYIFSGTSNAPKSALSAITVQYIVTRVKANPAGTYIPLPSMPRGDVQVTINGIALTKGTPQFTADYIVDPANTTGSSGIIIQNSEVIGYLAVNPEIQIAYAYVKGTNDINLRSEVVRVDSFNSSKIYFNPSANKYVYKLNYKVNDARDIKFLIDGIALEPPDVNGLGGDYRINVMNPYEVFLPKGIRYGTVISVYYLVGGNSVFAPVIADNFGIGDISKLSFLEFLELVQRKMINARNRKTISDFKGGWYPTVQQIYEMYLQRSLLAPKDPLQSNGYTFQNLYPFLSKYNAFFQRFIDQLLSATIILKRGGLLIRNSIFTKQKYTYKRGVNLYDTPTTDMRGNDMLQYFGDDGSTFLISQSSAPAPVVLHVDTKVGTPLTNNMTHIGYLQNTGGELVSGYTSVTEYGMEYKKTTDLTWLDSPSPLSVGPLAVPDYTQTIPMLQEGQTYQYRAVVKLGTNVAYGDTLSATIPITPPPLMPSGKTKVLASVTPTSIVGTGGYDIQKYSDIAWYGMQYSAVTFGTPFNVTPVLYSGISKTSQVYDVTICGDVTNNYSVFATVPWLVPEAPDPPTPAGITQTVLVCTNAGAARTGCTIYTPTQSPIIPKVVEFRQVSGLALSNAINVCCIGGSYTPTDAEMCGRLCPTTPMTSGQYYYATFSWHLNKPSTLLPAGMCVCLVRNGVCLYGCAMAGKTARNCTGTWSSVQINCGDCVYAVASAQSSDPSHSAYASVILTNVVNGVGTYSIGSPTDVNAGVGYMMA